MNGGQDWGAGCKTAGNDTAAPAVLPRIATKNGLPGSPGSRVQKTGEEFGSAKSGSAGGLSRLQIGNGRLPLVAERDFFPGGFIVQQFA